MKKIFGFILMAVFLLGSCEYLDETSPDKLSEEDIILGLKTALEVGADTATTTLHATDGYFLNQAVKILLPPEADIITSNIAKLAAYLPGGFGEPFFNEQLIKLTLSLNRAAEDAADKALPILSTAITGLSINDGWDILNGIVPSPTKSASGSEFDSLAASHYLQQKTKIDLIIAFSSPINASLDKPLVGNTSTNAIWSNVTKYYNDAVKLYNIAGFLTGKSLEEINGNLSEYATEKALDGLFIKVGEEEKKIRKDPFEYALDILEKVFGSLLNK